MPPVSTTDLADDQRFALMKFRRSVSDCLKPGQDDHFLLRWLKARNFNPEAAEKMLRDSLRWRERWDVDRLLTDWTPPSVLADHFPSGIIGLDRDQVPVVVVPFGSFDLWGILHVVPKTDFIRMTIRHIEKYLGEAARASRELGRPSSAPQIIALMDMEGFSLRQYMWRPAGEAVLSLVHMYEANYPEILKVCLIINAPSVFPVAFSVVRPFLHENTVRKIQIFGNNARKWRPVLHEFVDPSQLPVQYGGTMTGPDGDPKCSDKIHPGGKVPKSMYVKMDDLKSSLDSWSAATVKKGQRLQLSFPVDQPGSYLKWEFRTEQHDIQFAVYRQGIDGQVVNVLEPRRISCQGKGKPEVGLINCEEAPANYTVEFDNSYSLLRNKKLHYQILVTPPLEADLAERLAEISVST